MGLLKWLKSRLARQATASRDVVFFDDQGIGLFTNNKIAGYVRWDNLKAVFIDTTDMARLLRTYSSCFWAANKECVVPQGAGGTDALLRRLGELPGFDYEAGCRAMCCTENDRFVCWQRRENGDITDFPEDH